ncbi:2-keto-4-pentenoate hydratase [Spinactinospora alkalitolerans]|uniref:2-keto-4-pentenoate hydratase n=1 Tax=Spinactinospora alkalitolerans TaxID=687207 RepID=A0A852TY68_9ACTN|nr:fumarylacetoacetate hydrolase family protein [Spinactinospora alkalitolerans]NYE47922.1 2-keto-4-pentenoate hydratase [Spinactinospora alkalitolerans]
MDTETQVQQAAFTLAQARRSASATSPLVEEWPELDADTAFRIQQHDVAARVAAGDRVVGFKLGNIAKAMQNAFGLDQPDYGHLLAGTFVYEGLTVDRKDYIHPFVELEPAFVLRAGLQGPNLTVADVISATDYVLPAIEIIDSRITDWRIGLPDTIADNGSTGSVVLGAAPRRLDALNLQDMHGEVAIDGEVLSTGSTSAILGNPVAAIAWLGNRLAPYGIRFRPGDVIMPGSCLRAVPLDRPGAVEGRFDGLGTVRFDVV